jgi:hypothetical protein
MGTAVTTQRQAGVTGSHRRQLLVEDREGPCPPLCQGEKFKQHSCNNSHHHLTLTDLSGSYRKDVQATVPLNHLLMVSTHRCRGSRPEKGPRPRIPVSCRCYGLWSTAPEQEGPEGLQRARVTPKAGSLQAFRDSGWVWVGGGGGPSATEPHREDGAGRK